jgi:hypothetical protein
MEFTFPTRRLATYAAVLAVAAGLCASIPTEDTSPNSCRPGYCQPDDLQVAWRMTWAMPLAFFVALNAISSFEWRRMCAKQNEMDAERKSQSNSADP